MTDIQHHLPPVTSPSAPVTRLRQFLAWIIPLNLAASFVQGLASLILHDLSTGLTAMILFGCTGVLLIARRQTGHGQVKAAVITIYTGLLGADMVIAFVQPVIWPTLAFIPLLALMLVLPYVESALLRYLLGACAMVTLVVTIIGHVVAPLSDLSPGFIALLRTSTLSAVVALIMLLLSQFRSQLIDMLAQTRTAQERYALAAQGANDGLWDWNLETNHVFVSARWNTMLGYPEHLADSPEAWFERIHPDDRERVETMVVAHLAGQTDHFESEHRMRCADGTYRWVLMRGLAVRDAKDRSTRMAGSQTDITERKCSEERLQQETAFVQLLQRVAVAANEASTIDSVMQVALTQICKYTGWPVGHVYLVAGDGIPELIPTSIWHLADPHRYAVFREISEATRKVPDEWLPARVLASRKPVWIMDLTREAVSSRAKLAQGSGVRAGFAFPVVVGTEVVAVLEFFSDEAIEPNEQLLEIMVLIGAQLGRVVERTRAEKALSLARDQALEASRYKSDFLATMSHEIRTPMNGIIGMTELLLGTRLTDQQREFTNTVHMSAQSLLAIINDILDFSRVESGKLVLEALDFELVSVAEGAGEIFAAKAREKQLSLMTYISPDIPKLLRGDAGRLRQVLLNLIGNAVKFTSRGDIVVRVTLEAATESDATVRFAITDTGIGLSPVACARLFQPFTQADASTTRKYGGTGLGLAICKRLVELMGGGIGVESKEGVGSTFWFTARFARSSASALSSAQHGKTDLQGLRVLVVDDNQTNRTIIQSYLRAWGMRDSAVSDGAAALVALQQAAADRDPYDVAILDFIMPEMDGLKLAKRIKRDPAFSATRLIFLTAFDQHGLGEQALQVGFSAYLTMPVRQSQLHDAIATAIDEKMHVPSDLPSVGSSKPKPVTAALQPVTLKTDRVVLLAEDNAVNQKVAQMQLTKLGYAVNTVNNGREAVEAMLQDGDQYGLVLMDCQMPEMDGFAATKAIRKGEIVSGRHIPIVAMTANAMEGDREACLAVGMDDYISKPVNQDKLHEVLERWIPATKSYTTN